MRKYKITLRIIILMVIVGLFKVNLNLNRQIYEGIVNDNNYKSTTKYKDKYNLDNMVDVLSYPEKYNVKSDITIPKIRVLFSNKPFDFRIDTNKYTFFINKNIKDKFKSNINNRLDNLKTYILHIGKKVKNIVP